MATLSFSSRRRAARILLWALSALLLLGVLRPPHRALKPDQAIYALAGSEMLQGAVPYRDVWDNKGPVLLFLFAGLFAVMGHRPPLYDLAQTFLVCALALGVYLVARRLWGREGGIGAAAIAVFACSFPAARELNAEILGAILVVFGIHLLLRGLDTGRAPALVGAGILLVTAPLAKPVFCLDLLAVGIAAVVWTASRRERGETTARPAASRAWGLPVLGALLGLLPWAAYFISHGALGDAWEVYVRSNFVYLEQTPLAEARKSALTFLEGAVFALAALWGLAAGGVAGLWTERRPRHEKVLLCAWMLATVLGVLAGRRFFPHYLVQAFAPAAILAGWPLALLAQGLRARQETLRRLSVAFALCLAFLLGVQVLARLYNSTHAWMNLGRDDHYTVNEVVTADYLRHTTQPGDRIFVVGMNGQLSLMTGLRPASRFIYTRYLWEATTPEARRRIWGPWHEDMRRHRPRYVILSNYNRLLTGPEGRLVDDPEFGAWLRRHYRHETTLRGPGPSHVFYNELYRRKD